MRKLLIGVAASATLFAAGAAKAAINVSLWVDQSPTAHDASFDNIATLGAADATLTLPFLDFSTGNSDVTTIDQFLGSSIGGTVGSHALDNTVFLFTGSLFLHAGDNAFVVPHDDGLQLDVSGFGRVIDAPGPTGENDTPLHLNAATAGSHTFQMSYGECCGGPAVIRFTVNDTPVTGAPEPATWGLMLVGFGGLGAMLRRRRSAIA
jgi:PEP-CTERM motif-containing protein